MSAHASWLLPAASDTAHSVDALFFTLLGVTGFVALAIAALVVFFCIRYRRGSGADRSDPPAQNRPLEIAWAVIPLLIFVGFFAWGAVAYTGFYGRAAGAMPVFVVGKQWMWRVEHANGRREINELHLPAGERVRLVLATEDVIHSFYVPAFRAKQDAVPGRYTELTITPDRIGSYAMHCSEYCGTDHARMGGRVIVMAPADFRRWLAQAAEGESMAARGLATYRRLACGSCHDNGSTVHAPDLAHAPADDAYLRESILMPKRRVVPGFAPLMPSFQGQVSEEEILELIAYIKSIGRGR